MSNRPDSSDDVRHTLDLERLHELSLDILCVMDPDGRYISVSRAVTAILGWSTNELAGQHLLDGVHPDDRDRVAGALARLGQGDETSRFDSRHRARGGAYVPLSWLMSADAATGLCHAIARDLSPLKALEQRIAELSHPESAGSSKTEFLASMNHELRTPLNAILGYTELLAGDANLTAKQREALDSIKRSGEHLLMLISDILDFAKLDAHKVSLSPREFLLPSFLKTIIELFEGRASQKNIAFIYQQTTSLPEAIACDETRLRQVLINLLSNAIKFTKVGGVILKTGYDGKKLRFQIEDTGIGIPPSHIKAVFRPFEQLHHGQTHAEGTGLGLSISSRLVELMGGTLHAQSEVGKGSTFWFEIVPDVATSWQSPTKPAPVGYDGPRRMLIVADGTSEDRAIMAQVLAPAGLDVREARSGAEAVELATAERPDLVFVDLAMPDGIDAIRRIRGTASLHGVPIIGTSLTALDDPDTHARAHGYDAVLSKPVRIETVFQLLDRHLGLTWRYQTDIRTNLGTSARIAESVPADTPAQAPDVTLTREQLQAIHDAAIIGDIREILVILEEAGVDGASAGSRRAPSLGAELYMLAKGFQGKQIREKLKPYLE